MGFTELKVPVFLIKNLANEYKGIITCKLSMKNAI